MDNIDLTMNDIELIDEIVRRADEHQKQKEKEFAIAEIKKLREEAQIQMIFRKNPDNNDRLEFSIDNMSFCDLIDKHISELKGKTNEIL
ncbi:MAG: hypothetical protein J6S67_14775 [Methanobrevibacter sp.]|nr:hypothetical protein [Methanobrevibacter sp.]